ncbi:hypothetical protein JL101_013885 [Skermanella rosea]|uniref:hypothetical protein n=1 Tax=Skermanella rosea TaxID=1817965 RepID=UPI0019333348|nr:hypothetical protein [Skermanella rosea]UEM06473.1 hypothetical protein JL101_013885 [Skermanella rosea]
MELLMLTAAARGECREGSHGGGSLPQDLEEAGEILRDLGIDRQSRPLVLPEVQVAAREAFQGGRFLIR